MKIAIYFEKSNFNVDQQKRLNKLGNVTYATSRNEMSLSNLINLAKDAQILGLDPDNFGGFEEASDRVTNILKTLPSIKGISLSTTSFGWLDLKYCKNRNIPVSNIPGYSREAVAEHTIALILAGAKTILLTDRRTQLGKYKLEMGTELKGKTLGIIGLGNIGSRTAELALGISMKVIAYNRTTKKQKNVEMVSLQKLLKTSDVICFHTTHEPKNKNFIEKQEIGELKPGVIIINTADREIINEEYLAKALKSGQVSTYIYEAEDFIHTPLANIETAIGIRGFGWYTKESIQNLVEIFVANIESIVHGKPQNRVV